jgi:hypothetical protein
MLFVACTRALDWVCLSTVQGRETMELEQLDELVKAGQLVEQWGPSRVPLSYDNWPEEDAPF